MKHMPRCFFFLSLHLYKKEENKKNKLNNALKNKHKKKMWSKFKTSPHENRTPFEVKLVAYM